MKCVGCSEIQNENFPFYKSEGDYFINVEGCSDDGEDLKITFCPVCGKKL